jgi:hypothetical protein
MKLGAFSDDAAAGLFGAARLSAAGFKFAGGANTLQRLVQNWYKAKPKDGYLEVPTIFGVKAIKYWGGNNAGKDLVEVFPAPDNPHFEGLGDFTIFFDRKTGSAVSFRYLPTAQTTSEGNPLLIAALVLTGVLEHRKYNVDPEHSAILVHASMRRNPSAAASTSARTAGNPSPDSNPIHSSRVKNFQSLLRLWSKQVSLYDVDIPINGNIKDERTLRAVSDYRQITRRQGRENSTISSAELTEVYKDLAGRVHDRISPFTSSGPLDGIRISSLEKVTFAMGPDKLAQLAPDRKPGDPPDGFKRVLGISGVDAVKLWPRTRHGDLVEVFPSDSKLGRETTYFFCRSTGALKFTRDISSGRTSDSISPADLRRLIELGVVAPTSEFPLPYDPLKPKAAPNTA